jgi:hypothetical protein
MAISSYSTTPGSNTTISGINIAEGCPPSGINDAIRQMMADIASGTVQTQCPTATGTANAIVVALTPAVTAYSAGQRFTFLPASDNTGATTINYGGGVINLQKNGGLALVANDILSGVACDVMYDGTRAVLLEPSPYRQGAAVASAATLVLNSTTGDYVHVTGTTGITAITLRQGDERTIVFDGALTITNGASLITGTGANITTVANDTMVIRGEASGVVRIMHYRRADGTALTAPTTGTTQSSHDNSTSVATTAYADRAGYQIEQQSKSAAYTTVLSDAGKHIWHPTADNNARTFTIDSNANVPYATGTCITFINEINTVTIAITSDTLVMAGTGSTGSRTLAANGMATAIKVSSTRWYISGTGLT